MIKFNNLGILKIINEFFLDIFGQENWKLRTCFVNNNLI